MEIGQILVGIIVLVLVAAAIYLWKALPIISGYGAKILCSGVFVCGRKPEDIIKNELRFFPIRLGRYSVDINDQSATGSVFGLAKKKAVYRKGLGATLLNGIDEEEFRKQEFNLPVAPSICQDAIEWPIGNRLKNTIAPTVNQQQLNCVLDQVFDDPKSAKNGTRAVIVLYNGEIVAERYAAGFSKDSRLAGWSMAKSVTSALIGILVKQNKLNINAAALVEEWQNDERKNITIGNLLHMSSGQRWWEYYAAPSDATHMLYDEQSMSSFAKSKPFKYKPETIFNYSSGSTNILSSIIRNAVGDRDYYRFPYEQLFYKIGMLNTLMEVDTRGTFASSSYCFSTARDWARFGLLYLNDGVWNGERILPEGWVKFTTTATPAKSTPNEGKYGAHWWLNEGKSTDPSTRKYPHVPEDCFRCQGYEGQYIWVIPSRKLVIVRLALEKGNCLDPDVFLPALINAFPANA
ncbi:MAG: serine hydrolase [Segetibacter sp.]|jgi:CubicO group peptidase (beta-lactamase class C family)|nr:serine hydrolase [Segetibacter sp.]